MLKKVETGMDLPSAVGGPDASALASSRFRRRLRVLGFAAASVFTLGMGTATGLARYGGAYVERALVTNPLSILPASKNPEKEIERLERRLERFFRDDEIYVTVDTHLNRLRIFRGRELLREAICSTGSGIRLRDPRNGREWIFDSPQGELRVTRKVKNPVWVKPDWAFIEEGYEPPKSMRDRIDDVSLGKYGLYLRDGYIIHGTIFQTLLGKRVTHGCVRLGDKDLEFAFQHVPVGARVFLF